MVACARGCALRITAMDCSWARDCGCKLDDPVANRSRRSTLTPSGVAIVPEVPTAGTGTAGTGTLLGRKPNQRAAATIAGTASHGSHDRSLRTVCATTGLT